MRIEPLVQPVAEARLEDLERVTAAVFGQRRKMLRQSLKQLTPDAESLLREAQIEPQLRPQNLTIADFTALARAYRNSLARA